MDVVVSKMLPLTPSHREDARRIVRHGMADVLAKLGYEVGPKPGEPTHALVMHGRLLVSYEAYAVLAQRGRDQENFVLSKRERELLTQVEDARRRADWTVFPIREKVSLFSEEAMYPSEIYQYTQPVLHDPGAPISGLTL